jgi:hypothetical protein
MPQFSLPTMTRVTVQNVNVRSELHGDEHVPAVDLSIKQTGPNTLLCEFHGAPRGMLYEKADKPSKQQQASLEGVEQVSDLPVLRCAEIEQPIKLNSEFAGYTLTVDRGLGGASNIVLGDCSVDKFRADCKEGGSVELAYRVQAAKLDADTLGKLATLIGCEVTITLEPPKERQAAIDGTEGHPGAKKPKGKAQDADPSGSTAAWPFPKEPAKADPVLAAAMEAHGVKDPA